MPKTCTNCGTEIAEKALICYRCGTSTVEAKYQPYVAPKRGVSTIVIAVLAVGALSVPSTALGRLKKAPRI